MKRWDGIIDNTRYRGALMWSPMSMSGYSAIYLYFDHIPGSLSPLPDSNDYSVSQTRYFLTHSKTIN